MLGSVSIRLFPCLYLALTQVYSGREEEIDRFRAHPVKVCLRQRCDKQGLFICLRGNPERDD